MNQKDREFLERKHCPETKETEHLRFTFGLSKSGRTIVAKIISRRTDQVLGEIKWHGPWRQYGFYPGNITTVWNRTCMDEVHGVITELMDARR